MFNESSVVYEDQNLATALEKVDSFEADLGGTEIYSPLDLIFKQIKVCNRKSVNIYLLTDGCVNNSEGVIKLVSENCGLDSGTTL
jgi:hypothetical protein